MIDKTANVHWEGPGKNGKGQISIETGTLDRHTRDLASRFEDDRRRTNPEEILAAKHGWPRFKALASVAGISLQATREMAAV